jgi:hypothetical protein
MFLPLLLVAYLMLRSEGTLNKPGLMSRRLRFKNICHHGHRRPQHVSHEIVGADHRPYRQPTSIYAVRASLLRPILDFTGLVSLKIPGLEF